MASQSPFRQSFNILHSLFTPIVIAFFLESPIFMLLLNDRLVHSAWGWLIPLLIFPLKIYFYSGIYGVLVAMTSGEIILFDFQSFQREAKRNWPICLAVAV